MSEQSEQDLDREMYLSIVQDILQRDPKEVKEGMSSIISSMIQQTPNDFEKTLLFHMPINITHPDPQISGVPTLAAAGDGEIYVNPAFWNYVIKKTMTGSEQNNNDLMETGRYLLLHEGLHCMFDHPSKVTKLIENNPGMEPQQVAEVSNVITDYLVNNSCNELYPRDLFVKTIGIQSEKNMLEELNEQGVDTDKYRLHTIQNNANIYSYTTNELAQIAINCIPPENRLQSLQQQMKRSPQEQQGNQQGESICSGIPIPTEGGTPGQGPPPKTPPQDQGQGQGQGEGEEQSQSQGQGQGQGEGEEQSQSQGQGQGQGEGEEQSQSQGQGQEQSQDQGQNPGWDETGFGGQKSSNETVRGVHGEEINKQESMNVREGIKKEIEEKGPEEAYEELQSKIYREIMQNPEKAIGTIPTGLRAQLTEMRKPKASWKELLRKDINKAWSGKVETRFDKRSRYGKGIPKYEHYKEGKMYLLMDTSGSIGEAELETAVGICHSALTKESGHKMSKLFVIPWDAEAYDVIQVKNSNDVKGKLSEIQGGGGTFLTPAVEKVLEQTGKKKLKKGDVVGIFTDGGICDSEEEIANKIKTISGKTGQPVLLYNSMGSIDPFLQKLKEHTGKSMHICNLDISATTSVSLDSTQNNNKKVAL